MKEEITKEKGGDAALEYCAEEAPKKSKLLETLQYCFLSFLHINIWPWHIPKNVIVISIVVWIQVLI